MDDQFSDAARRTGKARRVSAVGGDAAADARDPHASRGCGVGRCAREERPAQRSRDSRRTPNRLLGSPPLQPPRLFPPSCALQTQGHAMSRPADRRKEFSMTEDARPPLSRRLMMRLMPPLCRVLNVPMRLVLALPISTPLGKRLMLAYLTGRKTGHHYRQPISYVRHGETLLTPGGGRWKLNLVEGQP